MMLQNKKIGRRIASVVHRFMTVWIVTSFIAVSAYAQPQIWGSASPSVVEAGTELVTLTWGSVNADYCEADGSVFPANGSTTSGPFPAGSHTVSFSCTGTGGTSYSTMSWTAVEPIPEPVLSSFSISPSVVYNTDPFTVSWSASNADTCSASSGDIFSGSGSTVFPAGALPVGYHSFSLQCSGPGGVSNVLYADITVELPPPAPVLSSLTISPSVVYSTQPFTVSWSASNADTCAESSGDTFGGSGSTVFPAGALPVGYHNFSMQCTGPGGLSNIRYANVTIELPPPPVPATPAGPTSSHTSLEIGTGYTVSWNSSAGASSYQLRQNGSAQTVTSTSRFFNPGSAGTYSYNVSACNASGCSAASANISVVVTDPPPSQPPAYLIGFDGDYFAYWSSGSSSSDLYFIRQSTDGNYEGVTDFILKRQVDGFYSLIANPTTAQISQFSLTTPASIGYELADINLDGAVDMVLLGTSGAGGIVYAATSSQSAPLAYKHVDEEFVEFFTALSQALVNPEYFDNSAQVNGWGDWVPYGPYIQSYWDTAILHLSGQTFVPIGLPPPTDPIPFYANILDAYNPGVQPFWCAINGAGGYRFYGGVWEVLGAYREANFVPNQDIVDVANVLATYLAMETPAAIPALIFQILEEILGVNHNIDSEPDIFNLIRMMGEIYFGLGVEQEVTLPLLLAKVELLYTDIGWSGLPPFDRHAYIQVTFPNGNKYVSRGGPQETPAFGLWGYLETQWFLNPTNSEQFRDYGKTILFRQLVGHTAFTEAMISSGMQFATNAVNTCQIPYLLINDNSNSYAFQAIQPITGLARPLALAKAPGSYDTIPCL